MIVPERFTGKVNIVLYRFNVGIPSNSTFPEMECLVSCNITRGKIRIFIYENSSSVDCYGLGDLSFNSGSISVNENRTADNIRFNSEMAYFRLNLSGIFSGRFPINPSVSVDASGFPFMDCITFASRSL